jgi:hypothetical protein
MQTLRVTVLALALLALASVAYAQQVQTGTTFAFMHIPEGAADTARYILCVDTAIVEACTTIGVVRVAATDEYRFTLPAVVARGNHALTVRAVGFLSTGTSDPSNAVNVRVVGKPVAPTSLREVTP